MLSSVAHNYQVTMIVKSSQLSEMSKIHITAQEMPCLCYVLVMSLSCLKGHKGLGLLYEGLLQMNFYDNAL